MDLKPGEAILHDGDPERCMVLLPGVRYFSQAPLLWFAREAAEAAGWSALELSERAPGGVDPFAWMSERARSALDATEAGEVWWWASPAARPRRWWRAWARAIWLTPRLVRPDVLAAWSGDCAALLCAAAALPAGQRPRTTAGDGEVAALTLAAMQRRSLASPTCCAGTNESWRSRTRLARTGAARSAAAGAVS